MMLLWNFFLGGGSYAKVWLAQDKETGMYYAVKELDIGQLYLGREGYDMERFEVESRNLERLENNCENVVKYYGTWVEG